MEILQQRYIQYFLFIKVPLPHTYTKVVQKVLGLTKILDLLHIFCFQWIYQPLHTGRMWQMVTTSAMFNRFGFRFFFLLDWLLNQGWKLCLPY